MLAQRPPGTEMMMRDGCNGGDGLGGVGVRSDLDVCDFGGGQGGSHMTVAVEDGEAPVATAANGL